MNASASSAAIANTDLLKVYITVDVEYAGMAHIGGAKADQIPDASMECLVDGKPMGLTHVVESFRRHGLKATFFVEPMASYRFGEAALARTVKTIRDAGQDVQLHLHPAWLTFKEGKRHSDRLCDYGPAEQVELIRHGKELLEKQGAEIVAFRAGGFAADDRQYQALRELGIPLSSSYCLGYRDQGCEIAGFGERNDVFPAQGVWEIPASTYRIRDVRKLLGFSRKPLQVGCTTAGNARRVLERAGREGMRCLTLLLHNWECLDRAADDWSWKPMRTNTSVAREFEATCAYLADARGRWRVTTFAEAARELGPVPAALQAASGSARTASASRSAGRNGAPTVPSLNRIYVPM